MLRYFIGVYVINRTLYMAAWRYEISLFGLKNISLFRCAHSWNVFSCWKRNSLSPRDHAKSSICYKTGVFNFRYSAPIDWLVHGHMTSNSETVSSQMPGVGNMAKTMLSNGKQFTVPAKYWPLLHIICQYKSIICFPPVWPICFALGTVNFISRECVNYLPPQRIVWK